ncbi:MAG: hypothetical protein K2N25_05815, partial [Muribaculaceae bacterium]|nr:hypothetical protein [Muribaculaceae bacterium]
LRVYEKYNGTDMPLFAFEVLNYDENGNAVKNPESDKFEAGTDAHSCNFVKYDQVTGLVFVACGQSGVYVFKLDTTVEVAKWPTGITTEGGYSDVKDVDEGDKGKFTVPAAPATEEGKDFVNWEDENGKPYQPGEEVEIESGKVIVLKPVLKDHEYKFTVKFDYFDGTAKEGTSGLPEEMKKDTNEFMIPDVTPVWGKRNFVGWSTTPAFLDFEDPSILKKGDSFQIPGDAAECVLYGVWSSNISGEIGGEPEPEPEPVTPPTPPVVGGEDTNNKE